MRTLPAAPAEVVAHRIFRNALQGAVQGLDVRGLKAAVLLHARSRDHHVPGLAQSGVVDLEDEAGLDDRPILRLERRRDGKAVFRLAGIVPVLTAADHARRNCGHEGLLDVNVLKGGLQVGEVALQERLALVGDRPRADGGRRGGWHGGGEVALIVLAEGAPLAPAIDPS